MIGTERDEPYFDAIRAAMRSHPRSLQRAIGPSQIGMECEVRLLHAIAGDDEPERAEPPWKPTVGTAVHAWLEQSFQAANAALGWTRWATEVEVEVGTIGGVPITGHADLFDTVDRVVMDHKCVGPKQLLKYRASGPGEQYRIQAHLYGLGFLRDPHPWGVPTEVAICFLPRDGELSRSYVWREPWQPAVAITALNRANRLWQRIQDMGIDAAVADCEPCEDPWCPWCSPGPSVRTGGTFFAPEFAR